MENLSIMPIENLNAWLHTLNLIAKLLLNSLYGRFGMIDSFGNQIIKDIPNLFNRLKGLFLKLTLLTLIFKFFKKYKFILF
jgi:hypothetical protein